MQSVKIGKYELKHPIIQGGMGLGISWDRLAGNVSLNGCLGVISSVGTGFYENRAHITKELNAKPLGSDNFYSKKGLFAIIENARKICGDAPLGVNIMYAANDYARIAKEACEAGINIIISGAGLPTNLPEFIAQNSSTNARISSNPSCQNSSLSKSSPKSDINSFGDLLPPARKNCV